MSVEGAVSVPNPFEHGPVSQNGSSKYAKNYLWGE